MRATNKSRNIKFVSSSLAIILIFVSFSIFFCDTAKSYDKEEGGESGESFVASFTYTPKNPTTDDTIQFIDTSTPADEIVSWSWDFGDGSRSTEQNPIHQYETEGSYTVTLRVRSSSEGGAITSEDISVEECRGEPLVAHFTFTPEDPTIADIIQFTDTSTGDVDSWSWVFDDEGTSTDQYPTHQYNSPDTYIVKLTVTDGTTSDVYSTDITVIGAACGPGGCGDPPVADFTYSPENPTIADIIQFTDTSTGDVDSWYWVFGDEGASTDQDPTHQYNNPYTYNVSLIVTDIEGQVSEYSVDIEIESAPIAPPSNFEANFTYSPENPTTEDTIDFTDTSTGDIYSYFWDFGDGNDFSSHEQHPNYSYGGPGNYTVNLTIRGQQDEIDSYELQITVSEVAPDECDIDDDGDGVSNCDDVCPGYDDAVDSDGDGIPDGCEVPDEEEEQEDDDDDPVEDDDAQDDDDQADDDADDEDDEDVEDDDADSEDDDDVNNDDSEEDEYDEEDEDDEEYEEGVYDENGEGGSSFIKMENTDKVEDSLDFSTVLIFLLMLILVIIVIMIMRERTIDINREKNKEARDE